MVTSLNIVATLMQCWWILIQLNLCFGNHIDLLSECDSTGPWEDENGGGWGN